MVTGDVEIRRYFIVDSQTGTVYLRSPLSGVQRLSFTFRIKVTDNGYPQKSDEADVVVRVKADRFRPLFVRSCSNQTVLEVSEREGYLNTRSLLTHKAGLRIWVKVQDNN